MAQAHSRGGVTGGIQAKLPLQVARIAIVLHCLGNGGLQETEISVDTFHAATKIGDYHLSHAHRALHKHEVKAKYFGEPTLQVKVFDVLEMHWPAWTSTTEMHADLGNNVTRAELNAVLQDGRRSGTGRKSEGFNGRPTPARISVERKCVARRKRRKP